MRINFTDVHAKVKLYLSVGRFEAAEKILQTALDEHGSTANLHNLLGVTYHKQSKFADAVVQFTKALKINHQFIEAGLNLAATFCDVGRYDEAKAVFSEVAAATPKHKKVPELVMGRLANHHAECGSLYEQSGMPREAIEEYKRALALYERMPDVRLALGKLYFRSQQLDRALEEFRNIVNQFPDEHDAHLWLGLTHWKLGNTEQAQRQWQTAHSVGGSVGAAEAYLKLLQVSKMTPAINLR